MSASWTLLAAALACAHGSPDLSGARGWLNVAAPVTLASLRGKVVVVDFADDWSVEGRRSLDEARELEGRFPSGVAVIGIRPPRGGYPAESRDTLRAGVLRRAVSHPVADDGDRRIAASFDVPTEPYLVVLDTQGVEAARFPGVGGLEAAAAQIDKLARRAREAGALDEKPLPLALERDAEPQKPLSYPTQLFYDAARKTLYAADTGNNRVVALSPAGKAKLAIGSWAGGLRDGSFDEAEFGHPEGVAASGDDLFVSDTDNDLIRRVQLSKRAVLSYAASGSARRTLQLSVSSGTLYIGAAGSHRVSAIDLATGHFYAFAGTGAPGRRDGLLALAQLEEPAAVASLGRTLWIADASAGSLRTLDLDAPGLATPALSGPGAPLAHPAALAVLRGRLFVADAGDGKLKAVDPATGAVSVVADGLLQPSGLAAVGDELVVADTGRSRLLRFSADGRALGELAVRGLKGPRPGPPLAALPPAEPVELPAQPVRSGARATLRLDVELPPGYELNPRGALIYRVTETRGNIAFVESSRKAVVLGPLLPLSLELPFTAEAGRTEAILHVVLHYCRADGKGLDYARVRRYRVVFQGSPTEKAREARVALKP